MFYSHEILTSRQYGVATIWLVATTGKSRTRRVTRKAIQEVDVQRACGKILEPGAPIALRLQGNLLYGVSCVHNQQCTYLVTDAKKTQDQMKLFFNAFSGNHLDPEAGKTRPENNLIEDDPAFDPEIPLPLYELENLVASQVNTLKTSSQMSPPTSQFSASQSPGQGFAMQLDIGNSSSSSRHGSPFGLEGLSSAQKPGDQPLLFHHDDDIFGAQGDWGLEIDENGNIVESAGPIVEDEQPQLPPLPPVSTEQMPAHVARFGGHPVSDGQGDVIMQEELFPVVEPFPERQLHMPWQDDVQTARQAPTRRSRRLQVDNETQISRTVLRQWQSHYLENCATRPRRLVSVAQAKRNAMLLTFGLGVGNIGQSIGVPGLVHPLALEFSGDALFMAITGIEVENPRGRRRTFSEAIEDDGQEEERRLRPRWMEEKEENEQVRAGEEDGFIDPDGNFADIALPEVGREAEHPMSDHHLSSTLLPWNRGSSAVPGSSTRAPNPTQQGRDLSSPFGKRRDSQDIVRYSDDAPMGGFGSDGNLGRGLGSADSSFDGMQVLDFGPEGYALEAEPTAEEIQAHNDRLFAQLDREGHNFIKFIQDAVNQDGERRRDIDFEMDRKWLAFDDLFIPRVTPRPTAAQAFYHTLCLVTKGRMYVEQDDADLAPFGAIWIGTKAIASGL